MKEKEMGVLENKVAVITGASRGIGEAIARAFVREGATVVLAGRSIEAITALADVPAEKIVWLTSPATDGKSGMEVNLLGPKQIATGALGELQGRVMRQKMVDRSPNVQVVEKWNGPIASNQSNESIAP